MERPVNKALIEKRKKAKTKIYDMSDKQTRDRYYKTQKYKDYHNNKYRREKVEVDEEDDSRYLQVQTKVIDIYSGDRDKTVYPNPNNYVIEGINVDRIISAEIFSSSFTNTLSLIKSTPVNLANNKIYWSNQDDIYNAEPYVYVTTIPDGNYNASQLETIIVEQMNNVKRINTDLFHNINVEIDQTTDTTTFESFESITLSNPFSIPLLVPGGNLSYVNVYYPGWQSVFNVGDSFIIENSTPVGVLSASLINGEHTIFQALSADEFSFEVIFPPENTTEISDQGGDNVTIKKRLTWKLLWSYPETIAEVIGYPEIDTEYNTIHNNSVEVYNFFTVSGEGQRIRINHVGFSDISPDLTTVYTTSNHNLNTGDLIFINYNPVDYSSNYVEQGVEMTYDGVYDHFKDEVVLNPTEEEDLQRFLSLLYNPEGLYISNVTNNSFTIGVPYVFIGPIETYINTQISDFESYGDIIIKNYVTKIQLTNDNLIYMCCPELARDDDNDNDYLTNNTLVKNIFCPIRITGSSGDVNVNTFIPYKKHYYTKVVNLKKLSISFRNRENNLIDFGETEHDFYLRLEVVKHKFKEQDYSTRNNYYL